MNNDLTFRFSIVIGVRTVKIFEENAVCETPATKDGS